MDFDDITPEKYFKKVTYSADPSPGNKLVVSNGVFVQTIAILKLIQKLEQLRRVFMK